MPEWGGGGMEDPGPPEGIAREMADRESRREGGRKGGRRVGAAAASKGRERKERSEGTGELHLLCQVQLLGMNNSGRMPIQTERQCPKLKQN